MKLQKGHCNSFCRLFVFQMSLWIITYHFSLMWQVENVKESVVWGIGRRLVPWSPLVTQQPPTLMKPSQVVCSGCRSEDSPLSLDVLFPGESCRLHVCFPSALKGRIHLRPEEKGGTVYEGMKAMVGSATLKLSAHLVFASLWGVLVLLFIYILHFICKGHLHSSQI